MKNLKDKLSNLVKPALPILFLTGLTLFNSCENKRVKEKVIPSEEIVVFKDTLITPKTSFNGYSYLIIGKNLNNEKRVVHLKEEYLGIENLVYLNHIIEKDDTIIMALKDDEDKGENYWIKNVLSKHPIVLENLYH